MLKSFYILFAVVFFLVNNSGAQDRGILALSGARFFQEGIGAKAIELKTDGSFLLSNKIPLAKEIEVRLQLPGGFTEERKTVFAAAEFEIVSLKAAILYKSPNLFKDNEVKGFPSGSLKELVVIVPLRADLIKADPGCIVKIRFYDLKSKNQLRIEFPVTIARPGESLQLSKTVNEVKTSVPLNAALVGVKIKAVNVTLDTSIRVNPKMAYASLDMTDIEGTTLGEVLSGKESYWVYDNDLNEVKTTDKQLKQVKGAMEDNFVDYLSKIPFRLKTVSGKKYFVRFRWESSDKRKVIDIVVSRS